ncbi:hypothetical protein [Streptomyces sp. NPDC006668]|uniref:hypothetical protein n=1 Tax=Streptomyces sp. NPDC006668 TaxID=3156903 RepID=UPI0033E25F6C
MDEDNRSALSRRHLIGVMTAAAAGASLPLAAAPQARASGGRGAAPAGLQVNSRTEPLGTETAPAFS